MKYKTNLKIAVDGFSSCGKSTVAKQLAKKINYTYIDSGAMYRAVTYYVIQNHMLHDGIIDENLLRQHIADINISFEKDDQGNQLTFLNGKNIEREIRSLEVSNLVSPVSKIKFVREAMVDLQRKLSKDKGVVMDGRDIGTVVFPDADLKIFMTASEEIRAQRRFKELIEKDFSGSFQEVLENIKTRDHIDSTRKESPLRKAEDAIIIDNSHLTPIEQLKQVFELFLQAQEM